MLRNPWIGWLKPSIWPEVDPPGHLFLARAFNVVGEVMFGDYWTGHEVEDAGKAVPQHLPSPDEVFNADGTRRVGLFKQYGPIVAGACDVPADEVSRPMWLAVHGYHRQERERVMQAIYRRDTVAEKCAELARSGDLRFAARKRLRGGDLLAIEPSEWQVDFPWMPFALLGFDEANGLCSPAPTHWLFVTLDSLNRVLGGDDEVRQVDDATPPTPPVDKLKELAAALDAAGVAKRDVKSRHIQERWRAADGPLPKVSTITDLMVGAGKGGRRAEA